MKRKILHFLIAIVLFFGFAVQAQDAPKEEKKPIEKQRMANCDACGYCFLRADQPGSEAAHITQPAPPAGWEQCRDCLYRAADQKGKKASDNMTLIGVPTPDKGYYYTQIGCISTDAGGFTSAIIALFFRLVGGIAFLYLLYGSFIIATSRSNPERLSYGRKILIAAIVGLLFALSAVFIVSFVSTTLGI